MDWGWIEVRIDVEVIDTVEHLAKFATPLAIRSGDLQQDLTAMKAGTVSHSRWLTTANAFMRLYVSNHGLTDPAVLKTLKVITIFIVGVYYHCWFEIKVKHD